MDSQLILPFALRFLPPLIVLALGFYAATDKSSRQRWAQLLYQAGNLRPEQRDDPKVQSGVKVPFFVLAFLMIFLPAKIGPLSYYRWATAKPEPVMKLTERKAVMDLDERSKTAEEAAAAVPTPTSVPAVLNPPLPPQPGGAAALARPNTPRNPGAPTANSAPNSGLKGMKPN